jgi:hypothetical protein
MPAMEFGRLRVLLSLATKLRRKDHVIWSTLGQDALTIS